MRATSETLCRSPTCWPSSVRAVDTARSAMSRCCWLQPRVLMVVVITSTGRRERSASSLREPVDGGLCAWAGEYLNERLTGVSLGGAAAALAPGRPVAEPHRAGVPRGLAPAFTALADTSHDTLFVDGAARLLGEHRVEGPQPDQRCHGVLGAGVALLGVLSAALDRRDVLVRSGAENELAGPAVAGARGFRLRSAVRATSAPCRSSARSAWTTRRRSAPSARPRASCFVYIEDVYEAR